MNKKILIGVAWPYVNGDLHLGHLSGYLLPADIFARYQRLIGNDVLMVSGSDCHGTPITVEADKRKVSPQVIVEEYHKKDLELFKKYNLSFNLYTKTSTQNHKNVTQEMFLQLLRNGYILRDTMQQYYSVEDDKYLPDRYVEGTCPHCNAVEQRSDQCESCGRWLKDGELIDPRSKLTGSPVTLKDTEHYFLDLKKLEPELKAYVNDHKDIWRKWIWQETDGWLKEGLEKRAITRDMDWAIDLPVEGIKKLPADKQLQSYDGKKIYVWFEAVIGYLSAAIEWSELKEIPCDVIYSKQEIQSSNWEDWWKNKECKIYNFMGQDNLVFHTLMWPAQLLGSKQDYTLPYNVLVNKFMNYEGKKFSKSRHWTIDSMTMANRYGVDPVRYYIASNFPENKEGNFTWEGFIASINNELVANLGNFINRTLKFFETKFNGEISIDEKIDENVKNEIEKAFNDIASNLDKCEFTSAIERLMEFSRFGNKYFDEQKIWEVIRTDDNKAGIIMNNLLNIVIQLPTLMSPFMPDASVKLYSYLNEDSFKGSWVPRYSNSHKLNSQVEVLFQKLNPETVLLNKDK